MRRLVLLISLASCCAIAHAGDTYRFRNGVVSVGDSIAGLVQRAGQPTRIVQLENSRGAAVGERWEYFIGSKLVAIEISGGKIYSISEIE